MGDTSRQTTGQGGEERAARFIVENGFTVLERNCRCGRIGEIDIIAFRENLVIFVEVKARRSGAYGGAMYSISDNKKRTLKRAAEWYINTGRHGFVPDTVFRFDLIAIDNDDMEWVQDIIRW